MYVSLTREDMFTPDSVEQLQKAGIDFQRHEEYGILPNDFAELMITSGMVLSQDTRWISFHRYVGFHFHSEAPHPRWMVLMWGSCNWFLGLCSRLLPIKL